MVDEIYVPRQLMDFTLRYIEENSTLMWGSGRRPTERIKDFADENCGMDYVSLARFGGDMGYSAGYGNGNTFNDLMEFIEGHER